MYLSTSFYAVFVLFATNKQFTKYQNNSIWFAVRNDNSVQHVQYSNYWPHSELLLLLPAGKVQILEWVK